MRYTGGYDASVPFSNIKDNEFALRPTPYRGVLVNSAGASTVIRDEEANRGEVETHHKLRVSRTTCWMEWCKPVLLLLLGVLAIVMFVFIAGCILYFNCKYNTNGYVGLVLVLATIISV